MLTKLIDDTPTAGEPTSGPPSCAIKNLPPRRTDRGARPLNAVTPPVRSSPLLPVVGHRQFDRRLEGRVGEAAALRDARFGRDGDDQKEVFCRALRWIAGRLTDVPV